MIYNKNKIDMSLVTCPFEEQDGYITIDDEYTNNVLKLSGYSDISDLDFRNLCDKRLFVDKLESYALQSYSNAHYSYIYARDVLDGRFELGEPVIATNAELSYLYAKYTLKGRFELGEQIISTDAHYSHMYARSVLKGRFELGETTIATDPYYSYLYARDVLEC